MSPAGKRIGNREKTRRKGVALEISDHKPHTLDAKIITPLVKGEAQTITTARLLVFGGSWVVSLYLLFKLGASRKYLREGNAEDKDQNNKCKQYLIKVIIINNKAVTIVKIICVTMTNLCNKLVK